MIAATIVGLYQSPK